MKVHLLALALAMSAAAACIVDAPRACAQSAEVVREAEAPVPEPARFSVGAGVGIYYDMGGSGLNGLAALGANLSVSSVTPFGTALFEWAAARTLRLMIGASGSYVKQLRLKGEERTGAPISYWTAGVGIGLRWVSNPGQVVEFSPAFLLGVHGGKSNDLVASSDGSQPHIDKASVGVDGRLGFVLEHALLPQLFLRFETYLLRGGVNWSASRDDIGRQRRAQAELGWGVSPMLQVRMTF
jgi:hypothetical protein